MPLIEPLLPVGVARALGLAEPIDPQRLAEEAARLVDGLLGRCGTVRFVYLDAGSRAAHGGEVFAVKLARLVREVSRGSVQETVEIAVTGPGETYPFLVLRGERARYVLTYLAELAAVYAAAREGCAVVVKHGPITQMVHHLVRPSYDLEPDVVEAALVYGGLDRSEARELVQEAAHGERVVAAAVVAKLWARMAEACSRDCAAVGVVEDVSSSRVLVAGLLTAGMVRAAERVGQTSSVRIAAVLRDMAEEVDASGCIGEMPQTPFEELARLVSEAILHMADIGARVDMRKLTDVGEVEAAVSAVVSRLAITDVSTVLTINYLHGPAAALTPMERRGIFVALRDAAKSEGRHRAVEDAYGVKAWYTYVIPGPPPTCEELRRLGEGLGLEPWRLAAMYVARQPIRVDCIGECKDALLGIAGLVWAEASQTPYGYPPGLIVADTYARVSPGELAAVEELAKRIAARTAPYAQLMRHWAARIQALE